MRSDPAARPVAMTLHEGFLYVMLDDPAEIDGDATDCTDCQKGTLWIVDVNDTSNPFTVYEGGLSGIAPGPDPVEVVLSGAKKRIRIRLENLRSVNI